MTPELLRWLEAELRHVTTSSGAVVFCACQFAVDRHADLSGFVFAQLLCGYVVLTRQNDNC
ncbi:hypothetical protein [Streptomyces sp. NPDC058964]|uniref:hypothetical protein n=1 Tax=Streptomyces sp. NPDC058964 TaxID=3346681 RepID=UPI0036821EAA